MKTPYAIPLPTGGKDKQAPVAEAITLANENARALRKRLTPQEVKLWVKLRELKRSAIISGDKHRSGITSSTSFRSDTDSLSKQTAVSTECPTALG
jgi:hypothetical protein